MEVCYWPEGRSLHTEENRARCAGLEALRAAMATGAVVEGIAVQCGVDHALTVKLGDFTGLIPREEGAIGVAEGETRDIALLSRVGKPVAALVTGIEPDGTVRLSRRAAQELALKQALGWLPGQVIPATVTHLEPFGAFVDIGCGFPSMIGVERLSVSRISHPKDRLQVGQEILAAVLSVDSEQRRIHLTHRELLGTWAENAAAFSPGMTVTGVVRGLKDYGVFVELAPNLSGLAEYRADLQEGDRVSVFLKSILPERMKIKLLIIAKLPPAEGPEPLRYFIKSGRLTHWSYAPEGCWKAGGVTLFDGGIQSP